MGKRKDNRAEEHYVCDNCGQGQTVPKGFVPLPCCGCSVDDFAPRKIGENDICLQSDE